MARSQRRLTLESGEEESRLSNPSAWRRKGPIVTVTAFFALCFVLNSALISTPSASSIHEPPPIIDRIGAITSILYSVITPLASFRGIFGTSSQDSGSWLQNLAPCSFPLPNLLTHDPIDPDHVDRPIQDALASLHRYLQLRTSLPDIDSLSIAVVTPSGPIFEQGYGLLRANDSAGKQYPVNKDSIYRIASVSKMFAVFEALLLRERGVLELDDPVEKYIPEFNPPNTEWPEYLRDRAEAKGASSSTRHSRITLRQLASHTAGLGRDYPVMALEKWPITKLDPPVSDERNSTLKNVLGGINEYPLVHLPYSYPIYSNVGFDMLGLAVVAANLKAKGHLANREPKTYKELVKRDIFEPFGLNSSFFRVPSDERLKDHIAVSSKHPQWAEVILGDVDDSAGGQYSSLGDLAKMAQVFLSATPPSEDFDFLPEVVREWLRPMHIWANGGEAVGAPWEISYLPPGVPGRNTNRFPGNIPVYSKAGNMPGYHSIFSLNPEYGYAVIVLVTGTYSKTETFALETLRRLQPAFEDVLVRRVSESYVGTWEGERGAHGVKDIADVRLTSGQLFLTALVVDGVDVISTLRDLTYELHDEDSSRTMSRSAARPMALWSTGRLNEFRMAMGRGPPGPMDMYACSSYWATIDFGAFSRGASVDLVYWENGELVYPSAGVRFKRKGRAAPAFEKQN